MIAGQIGYGYWGPNLARNFLEIEGVRLKYICDASRDNLAEAAARCPGVALTEEPDVLLADDELSAVVIASPARTHFELAEKALRAGKHVFVEKPMSLSLDEGRRLVRTASEMGLVLMVGHLFVYHPAVRFIKEYISRGHLGRVFYIYSQRLNLGKLRRDENCLWSLAPHDISIMLNLLDSEPDSVVARGASYLQEGLEDVVFLTLYFPGGQTGNIHVSWLDPQKVRCVTVVGSEKMIVFDDMSTGKVKIFDKRVYPAPLEEVMGYGDEMRIHFGDETVPEIEMAEPLRIECSRFRDAVRDGVPSDSDAGSGLAVIKVLDAATLSLASGGTPIAVEKE